MPYHTFHQFLIEASLAKTLQVLDDRSFGIITGGDVDSDKLLGAAVAKAKYGTLHLIGEFVRPSKEKDKEPTRTPDSSFVVIGGEKTDPLDLRKFLFNQADKFNRPSFMFKAAKHPKILVIGVDEEAWPGRNTAAKLGEYSNQKFVHFVKKWKGSHYEFLSLTM